MVLDTTKLKHRNRHRLQPVEDVAMVDGQEEEHEGIHGRFFETKYIVIRQKNWLDRAEVHRNGQVGTRGSLLPSIQR